MRDKALVASNPAAHLITDLLAPVRGDILEHDTPKHLLLPLALLHLLVILVLDLLVFTHQIQLVLDLALLPGG